VKTLTGRVAMTVGIAFFLFFGAWAFIAPASFFRSVAPWDPYNEHLFHDAGAFSVGLGVALLASIRSIARLAALVGTAAGASLHAMSHVIDRGDGGRSSDPYVLSALAVVLLAGLIAEWRRMP
jgi:hypothetical protein